MIVLMMRVAQLDPEFLPTDNFEKFLLYLLLGVSVGLVLFLVVVVTQLLWDRRRARKEAKMMHDPLTSVFAAGELLVGVRKESEKRREKEREEAFLCLGVKTDNGR